MTRLRLVLAVLLAAGAACTSSGDGAEDRLGAVRRYVEAWPDGRTALAATVTGADAGELVTALSAIREGGVASTTLERAAPEEGAPATVEGTARLHFADGARLDVLIRARVDGGRVRAEPAAVAAELTRWEPLELERFGSPLTGRILSGAGSVLAEGPAGARSVSRPGVAPAVALADEASVDVVGARRGARLRAGEPPRTLAEVAPVDGRDAVTSLDDALQAAAEAALGAVPGALVAVDPRTGGIRALASNPHPDAPDRSPATSAYPPGSTFKLVTAAAALESGRFDIGDTVRCPATVSVGDREVSNFRHLDYGPITFEQAFAVSCNTAFAQIGIAVGAADLLATAERLGFRIGSLDGPATITPPLTRGEVGAWSFGASGTLSSPLHLAGIGATIAAGGHAVTPGWVDRGDVGRRVLREATTDALVTMMEEVVTSGTGRNAQVPGAVVAGKTGTADPVADREARSDAWFVGLAPSRDARLVVVGLVPRSGIGGEVAAPLVQNFLVATAAHWQE